MKKITVSMTYDIVTPESAEEGDVAEAGYEWRPGEITVREALRLMADNRGGYIDNGDGSFYCPEALTDYSTGEVTSYAIHFGGVTPSSLKRIARAVEAN